MSVSCRTGRRGTEVCGVVRGGGGRNGKKVSAGRRKRKSSGRIPRDLFAHTMIKTKEGVRIHSGVKAARKGGSRDRAKETITLPFSTPLITLKPTILKC